MKYLLMVVWMFTMVASEKKEDVTVPCLRYSVDHKAEAEGLKGELARTKSQHEREIKEHKTKVCATCCAAFAAFVSGIGSIIYSVKKCN